MKLLPVASELNTETDNPIRVTVKPQTRPRQNVAVQRRLHLCKIRESTCIPLSASHCIKCRKGITSELVMMLCAKCHDKIEPTQAHAQGEAARQLPGSSPAWFSRSCWMALMG